MPASSSRGAVLLAFAAVYLIWGSTYLGIQLAINSIPPLLMAGSRFALAGALLYGFMRGRGEPAPSVRGWLAALIIGICLLTFGNGGVTLGEQYISSGLAALLVATVPMFMALLGWWSGNAARPTLWVALGLACGLLGVYLLARAAGSSTVARPGHETLGVLLVLGAGLVWAIGSLYAKKHQPSPSPFLAGGMQMLCGGGVMLLVGLLRGEAADFKLAHITLQSGVAYAYLVVFGSLVAFTAYSWLLRVVEPTLAGTYAFVNPVVAVLLGWVFADEALNPQMLGGGALIVAAVALVTLGGRRAKGAG